MSDAANGKVRKFFESHPSLDYRDGEIILRPFEDVPGVFLLEEGVVRMFSTSRRGEELTLHLFRPYSYFPLPWIEQFDHVPYYFEAVTDVSVRQAPRDEAWAFINSNPDVLQELNRRLLSGLAGYTERLRQLMFGDSFSKTVSVLVYLAHTFGESAGEEMIRIQLPFTHEMIASWAGVTRVSVSQAMSRLRKDGLIDYTDGRIDIPVLAELEKYLEPTAN